MNVKLIVNGKVIKSVNIQVDNPDFQLDPTSLAIDFDEWVKAWFGVDDDE